MKQIISVFLCILLCFSAYLGAVAYVDEDELPGIIVGIPLPSDENIETVALVGYGFQSDEKTNDGASIIYMNQGGWWAPNEFSASVTYCAGSCMEFQVVFWDVAGNQWTLGSTKMMFGSEFMLDRINDYTALQLTSDTGCILDIQVSFPVQGSGSYPSILIEQRKEPISTRDLLVLKPANWEKLYAYTDGPEALGEYPGSTMRQLGLLYHLPLENGAQKLILSTPDGENGKVKTEDIKLKDNGKDVTVIIAEDGSHQVFYDTLPDGIRKVTARIPAGRYNAFIDEFEPGVLEEYTLGWMAERNRLFYTFIRDTTEELQISCVGSGGALWESGTIKLEPNGKDVGIDLSDYEADVQYGKDILSRKVTVIPPSSWCSVEVCHKNTNNFGSYPGTALYHGADGFVTDIPANLISIELSGRLSNGNRKKANTVTLENNGMDVTVTIAEDGSYTVLYAVNGDLTEDGKLNIGDVARLYAHLRGSTLLTDAEVLLRADITGDGNLNMGDVAKLYSMIRGTLPPV